MSQWIDLHRAVNVQSVQGASVDSHSEGVAANPAGRLFRMRVDSRGRHSGKRHENRSLGIQGVQETSTREASEDIGRNRHERV